MTSPERPVTYTEQPPEEFSYEDYLAAAALVTAWLATYVAAIAAPYMAIRLTRADWLTFLAATYPLVEEARRQHAELARRFYDSERAKHVGPIETPRLPEGIRLPDGTNVDVIDDHFGRVRVWERLDINLAPYSPDWYEEAMDAVIEDFIRENVTDNTLARVIGFTVKEAENGGRRTSLWAVDDDPEVIGWARVEGNENVGSCGFCAMLISRGPVYNRFDPSQAGFRSDDDVYAVEQFRQARAINAMIPQELMTRWHPNCDCKVVPVFDRRNWPGMEQYAAMEDLWIEVMKEFEEEHGRPPKQGSAKRDNEALNAFRRRIERGDLPRNVTRPRLAA